MEVTFDYDIYRLEEVLSHRSSFSQSIKTNMILTTYISMTIVLAGHCHGKGTSNKPQMGRLIYCR